MGENQHKPVGGPKKPGGPKFVAQPTGIQYQAVSSPFADLSDSERIQ